VPFDRNSPLGGPRHSVERGHGSLKRDVARAASLCERRHRRAGGPAGRCHLLPR